MAPPESLAPPSFETFESLRPLLFSIAYRMLATVSEAEDVVQEAFLRYHRATAGGTIIDSPKAYLSALVTRLCIDYLRSARIRRESYVGAWLPEPLTVDYASADPADDPAAAAEESDSLSMAFLLILERLTPVERAVFLLRDVFDYPYEEIAGIVGKSAANCRQVASRARRHVAEHRPRFDASDERSRQLADRFFAAASAGDLDGLVAVLADDVVVYGDSGGVPPSWPRPIVGAKAVARLMIGVATQMRDVGLRPRLTLVNGRPGAVVEDATGRALSVFCLEIAGGRVQTVRSVINPAKLGHLGPLADRDQLRQTWREARETST